MSIQFEGIYFNQSRVAGEMRMSTDGLGWRATQIPTGGSSAKISKPFLLPGSELLNATWSRGAYGYMLQLQTRTGAIVSLDGFSDDQFVPLQRALSSNLSLQLEHREHSLRGWNWGKIELDRNQMVMNVASKPDFEIPYHSISNSNVVGRSEVAIEYDLPSSAERTTAGDEIVEMRFYLPGTQTAGGEGADDDEQEDNEESKSGDEEQVITSAQAFHEQLQEHANIGSTAGSELVQFSQILSTTPRGRYDMQLFEDVFRLHGKTYDYKVPIESVQRIFLLPRLDEQNIIVVIQLDPPLKQGQVRYPFLVMQFNREEEIEVELNVEEDEFNEKYSSKLKRSYDAPTYEVICSLLTGLSGRKVIMPSSFKSTRNLPGISCLSKSVEAVMYPLEKALLFVSKNPLYIPYSEIVVINFNRLATGNRTFDMSIKLRSGGADVAFTGMAREDQPIIEQFFQSKNITTKSDADDSRRPRLDLDEDMDDESEDDEDFDASDDESDEDDDSDASDSDEDSGAESFDEEIDEDVKPSDKKKQKRN